MTEEPQFLDSYAPIEGEVVTDAPWPMPEPKPAEPSMWQTMLRLFMFWAP